MKWLPSGIRASLLIAALSGTAQAINTGIGGPNTLFTSSSAYCSPPKALLITALDLKFFKGNATIEFDFSAASVQEGLDVIINVQVNAYGMGLFALTLDLCESIRDVLCPLPTYNFHGRGIFPVPEQFVSNIPDIGYQVPNLEAVATVLLTDKNTGETVGCVQATLSNGKSTYQTAAKWASIGVFLLAAFSSILHTALARSLGAAQWRVVDVLTSIQHIGLAALLNLNYPQVYIEFSRNFAWSLGIINIPAIQDSIASTRYKTGGAVSGTFGKLLTAQTGRRFNPFSSSGSVTSSANSGLSLLASPNSSSTTVSTPWRQNAFQLGNALYNDFVVESPLYHRQTFAPYTGPGGRIAKSQSQQQLPVISINSTSPVGIDYFVESNDISPDSAFLTVLVSFAMLFAIIIGICAVVFALALLLRLPTRHRNGRVASWSYRFTRPAEFFDSFCRTLFGSFMLMTWQVLLVFAFWQWMAGDSWVPDFLAAVFVALYLLGFSLLYFPVFRYARRGSRQDLYYGKEPPAVSNPISRRWGPIVHPFRPKYLWFGLVFLLAAFIRACFISFAQGDGHGMRQAVGLATTDVLLFLVLCILRPGRDKTSDFIMILLTIFRLLSWGVNIAFTTETDVTTIPRVIIGFAQIVVTGWPVIFLFFLTVWDLITPFFRKRQMRAAQSVQQKKMEKEDCQFGTLAGNRAESGEATMVRPSFSPKEGKKQLTPESQHMAAAPENTAADNNHAAFPVEERL